MKTIRPPKELLEELYIKRNFNLVQLRVELERLGYRAQGKPIKESFLQVILKDYGLKKVLNRAK